MISKKIDGKKWNGFIWLRKKCSDLLFLDTVMNLQDL
jgi:hypothetical protein